MSNCKCVFHEDTEYKRIYSLNGCVRFACPECDKVLIRSLA